MTFNATQFTFQSIPADYSKVLFTIHNDGRISIADHLTVDEAAREFWNAVQRLNPLVREPMLRCDRNLTHDEIEEMRAAFASTRGADVLYPVPDVAADRREQCVRLVVAKLMSHYGFELANPNADVLELENPRARAWVLLSREIVDALFADKQG